MATMPSTVRCAMTEAAYALEGITPFHTLWGILLRVAASRSRRSGGGSLRRSESETMRHWRCIQQKQITVYYEKAVAPKVKVKE